MRKHPVYILMPLVVILATAFLLACGAGGVKTPKYPGADAPIGTPQTPPPEVEEEKVGDENQSPFLTPPAETGEGTGEKSFTPPEGAEGLANRDAEPLAAGSSEEDADEEEETVEGEEEAAEEEPVEEEEAEEEESDKPYREQTPEKYTKDLGEFAFYYNNAGQGPVGELNLLLEAIDLLSVNEEKYAHASDFLTAEMEGLSRGDPLFIPDAVPEELRPLIPGEGIEGSMDDALRELFRSQIQANLRLIPINIVGVMEYGGTKTCIGIIWGTKFTVNQGQTTYRGYGGWYVLGITGTLVSEDLVILSLALYSYSWGGLSRITDPVPRSFHIGIT